MRRPPVAATRAAPRPISALTVPQFHWPFALPRGGALPLRMLPLRGDGPQADPSAALERCAKEMEQYDKCMEKWSKSHSLTYYRVQEEYRKKGVQ